MFFNKKKKLKYFLWSEIMQPVHIKLQQAKNGAMLNQCNWQNKQRKRNRKYVSKLCLDNRTDTERQQEKAKRPALTVLTVSPHVLPWAWTGIIGNQIGAKASILTWFSFTFINIWKKQEYNTKATFVSLIKTGKIHHQEAKLSF